MGRLVAGNNVAIRPIVAGEPILTARISARASLVGQSANHYGLFLFQSTPFLACPVW
jgi:hypothetical protein